MKKLILFLLLFGNYVFAQKWVQIYDNGLKKAELLKYEDSIIDFSAVILANPNLAGAYYNRGWSYANIQEYTLSIEDFTKSINFKFNLENVL